MQSGYYIDLDAICVCSSQKCFAGVVWSHKNSTQQKGSQIGPEIVCLFGKKRGLKPEAKK